MSGWSDSQHAVDWTILLRHTAIGFAVVILKSIASVMLGVPRRLWLPYSGQTSASSTQRYIWERGIVVMSQPNITKEPTTPLKVIPKETHAEDVLHRLGDALRHARRCARVEALAWGR